MHASLDRQCNVPKTCFCSLFFNCVYSKHKHIDTLKGWGRSRSTDTKVVSERRTCPKRYEARLGGEPEAAARDLASGRRGGAWLPEGFDWPDARSANGRVHVCQHKCPEEDSFRPETHAGQSKVDRMGKVVWVSHLATADRDQADGQSSLEEA